MRRTPIASFPAALSAVAALAIAAVASLSATSAGAVPAFAVQTGAPCAACHIGGFGPQLTTYGRDFKLRGYTARSGSTYNLPLSAMAIASFVNTQKDQASPPAAHYSVNDNWTLDQASLFLAGGFGQHLGAFIQATYDGVARAFTWDNVDLRAVTDMTVAKHDVLLGVSVNNNPTMQDAWNTTPAWGYPYTGSALAPGGAPGAILGSLAQTTMGATAYAWIDSKFYVEGGGYGSIGSRLASRLGADPTAPGNIKGLAPYGRLVYQSDVLGGTGSLGLMAMNADIEPGLDASSGAVDKYRDVGVDASYIRNLTNGDTVAINARYLKERQHLNASYALGLSANSRNDLTDLRADVSYFWRNRIGVTLQGFDTTGSPDALLFASNRNLKPDTTGLSGEISATPWGAGTSPMGPRFNLRLGLQYTYYVKYDGAGSNYDGLGAKAGDNNTLRLYAWTSY